MKKQKQNVEEIYLKDEEVHKLAKKLLIEHLGLEMSGGQYSEEEIWEVLLLAASRQTSIEQVCKTSEVGPSGNTVRGIIHEQLEIDRVEEKANQIFQQRLPKRLRKKRLWSAIDLVLIPYHGEPKEKQEEIVRSQPKSGTTHFHAYATAFVVERGRRFTLAITFVRSTDELTQILERLQARVKGLEIRVKSWLLDREFYTVEVVNYMKSLKRSFIIPMVIRGKKNPPGGTRALVSGKKSYWTSYTMRNKKKQQASFRVAIVAKNCNGDVKTKGRRLLAFALYGVRTELKDVAQIYRRRFGIETSHRQMHQGRGRTTSRSPVLRLLFVAIAFMLRNLWAWLHWAVVAQPRRGGRRLQTQLFSLDLMLNWIARVCEFYLQISTKLKVGYTLSL